MIAPATTEDTWIPRNTPGRRGPKPGTPEARRGGDAVRAKYGSAFYSEIGQKGGMAVKQQMGPEFYARIGQIGGRSTKARYGEAFYSEIGTKGGKAGGKRTRSRHLLHPIDGP